MIGLDTNVLVRYITQDDPAQAPLAASVIEEQCTTEAPGYVNQIVLCELVWVLKRCYNSSTHQALQVIEQIMRTAQLQVQDPQVVWKALKQAQSGQADFADCLSIQVNLANDCAQTLTLDQAAAQVHGATLITA